MPRDVERAAVRVLSELYGEPLPTPEWLLRPGKAECGARWDLVRDIYHRLTGLDLPETMRLVERRQVDGVFGFDDHTFVFELDETQHFNQHLILLVEGDGEIVRVAAERGRPWIQSELGCSCNYSPSDGR